MFHARRGQVEDQRQPVPVDEEEEGQEALYGGLGDDVCVQAVAQVDGVDVVTVQCAQQLASAPHMQTTTRGETAYHSKSLYMMVKKTCRNRLTAFMRTASRKSHASPDIVPVYRRRRRPGPC